jgi:FkbM family methyltransferase
MAIGSAVKRAFIEAPGVLDFAWWCSAQIGDRYGIAVRRKGDIAEIRKNDRVIRLRSRQVRRAPEICRHFELYRHVMPVAEENGVEITDFTTNPTGIFLEHLCLKAGVNIERRDDAIWLRKDRRVMILAVRHFIYCPTLAERFDLYFNPLVPREQDGLLILDYSRPGTVQRYARSGLEFEMASFPEEEEAIDEYFRWYRPRPGDLVFDLGAHCGVSTYALSRLAGSAGRVIAFEPDPLNYSILLRNIERHRLTNVLAVNVAIAGKTGQLRFNCEGTIGSGLTSAVGRESVGSTLMVDAVTLADAFEKWGVPAFCKIDIEGAEIEVLEAAKEALTGHATQLAIDTNHPQANGKLTDRPVANILRSCGYQVLSEARPLMTTWARPGTIG